MYKVALKGEKFALEELNLTGLCMWCGKDLKKNKAHIISAKLIKENSEQNILNKSICISCNAKWGKIEDWLLNVSPLSLFRFLYHRKKSKGLHKVPQYHFNSEISNWLAIYRDKAGEVHHFKQILFKEGKPNLFLIGLEIGENRAELYKSFNTAILQNKDMIDINESLPDGFLERIIITEKNNIIVAKSKSTISPLLKYLEIVRNQNVAINSTEDNLAHEIDPNLYSDLNIQFLWNEKIWELYCIKLFFEFLAMHKSTSFCLHDSFKVIRNLFQEFEMPSMDEIEKIVLEKKLTFLAEMKNKSLQISFLKEKVENLSGIEIDISGDCNISYEVKDGIMIATIQFGFCPLVNIEIDISKTNVLNDFFYTSYRYETGDFLNIRLSKTWERNRLLLFSRDLNESFNHYPSYFKKIIPIVE